MSEDLDKNHSGNAAISGATITLLDSAGVVIATTVSDSSGGFLFVSLPASNYTVIKKNLPSYLDVSECGG